MPEQFSQYRYLVELTFIDMLNRCKWWQFKKRRDAYRWRDNKLKKL